MSKPELPKTIDPLPAPKAAEARPSAPKKTGWEPASPQKQRVSERKLGMLLAVCLLVALGFVSYKKFTSNRSPAAVGNPLTQFGKLSPEKSAKSPPADDDAAQPLPPADLGNQSKRHLLANSGARPTPADAGFFGVASPPEQAAPVASTEFHGRTPTFDLGNHEPPPQAEPQSLAADESSNPFFGGEALSLEAAGDIAVEASDPFATGGLALTETDTATFSSDAVTEFGDPADVGAMQPVNELTFNEPPAQSEPKPLDPSDASSSPVFGLFGIEPDEEQTSELAAQPEHATPSPVASPWGAGTIESSDATFVAESEPPLIEPNDPQVMPALTLGPFGTAAAGSTTDSEPAVSEPVELGSGFNPYPAATVKSSVQLQDPSESQREVPFPAGGGTTVVERATNSLHDPFAPARDVRHAIREDEVHVHQVQSGDNFWSIAKEHYGSGKYFTALAAYNQTLIPDPRRIRPGMKVQVPSETVLAQQFPQLVSGGATVPYAATPDGPPGFALDAHGRPCYRIAKGDTLSGIAQRHLGRASRWRQIFGMNIDQLTSADSLTTGMVLRLPADATQIRMDAAGIGRR